MFLNERRPLVFKAARWLAEQAPGRPMDLSKCVVVVSTAGAMRRLRGELAREAAARGTGVLPPVMNTPMGLLDAEGAALRADSLLAWADVIARAPAARFPELLAGFSNVRQSAFRIAQSLAEVCAVLAEAGLTPLSPEIVRACPNDEDRWREIAVLYRGYLQRLEKAGFADANVSRIAAAERGETPPGIERIVVMGVPDLNPLVERYLAAVRVPVTVLVDAVDCEEAEFDAWGRPGAAYWAGHALPVPDVLPLADLPSEAEAVARLLGVAGLCVADPALLPHLQRALLARGRESFDPAGVPLARFECAAIARLWVAFCQGRRIGSLRALAEQPVFLEALCRKAGLVPGQALEALDRLAVKYLIDLLPDAVGWFREHEDKKASALVAAAEKLRVAHDVAESLGALPGFLREIYAGHAVAAGSTEAEALTALGGVLESVVASPLGENDAADELLAAETQAAAVYGNHAENAIELNGWLEAAWLPHEGLVISGGTEGVLPSQVTGHPFLPEGLRTELGLPGNAQRLARDIFLLHGLMASRPAGKVKLTLSRTGAEGEPAKPSRLLFRCPEAELPGRVKKLFGPARSLRSAPARRNAWLLEVPPAERPASLGVTAFGDYLDCPLRFYFKHVLRMDNFDPRQAEMDARVFGEVLHLAVEGFSRDEKLRESRHASEIEKSVLGHLDEALAGYFGNKLSLPVKVQRESLRARLRRFAAIQARERAAGWRIVEAEIKFKEEKTITLGGISVVAKIDRVEVHEKTGQRRILDYKTYKGVKGRRPAETHFEKSPGDEGLPEAEFEFDGQMRRWKQLQLPLYRRIAAAYWPDDPLPPVAGYFLLPERVEESEIFEFALDDALFASALRCAEAVADRVRRGVYWPPRESHYDGCEELFFGREPEEFLSPASVKYLEGDAAA